MAPLELVMIFPFLMLLVATIFFMARAVATRTATITQARHDAFAGRDQARPGTILHVESPASASPASATVTGPVAGGPALPGMTFQAKAVCTTTGRTWGTYAGNTQEVSFDAPFPYFVPSPTPIGLLVGEVKIPELSPFQGLDFTQNPAMKLFPRLSRELTVQINTSMDALDAVGATNPQCGFKDLDAVKAGLVAAQVKAAANPAEAAALEPQIQNALQLVKAGQPCLKSLQGVRNGANQGISGYLGLGPTGKINEVEDLGSQLKGLKFNTDLLPGVGQLMTAAP
jgi:hypothetical protein